MRAPSGSIGGMITALKCMGALVFVIVTTSARASEVVPVRSGTQFGVEIAQVKFPDSLAKDLTSGLTNRLLLRVVLNGDSTPMAERAVEISIRYDLWDEKYQWTVQIDNAVAASGTYANSQEMMAFLEAIKLPRLFAVSDPGRKSLTIRVDMLLNPIERERMEKIRKWVADNSSYVPMGGAGGGRAASSRPNPLFNKIFEEYSNGAALSATWKESAVTKPFVIDEVADQRGDAR